MGEKWNAYSQKVRNYEDLASRWWDNIKLNHRETEWGGMDWIDLAQDRDQRRTLVNTVMNLRLP
jgi:hypothetical protein